MYHQLIESLRSRIDAMDGAIEEISTDLRKERAARMEAEDRAVVCERDRLLWLTERQTMLEAIANCRRESVELADRVSVLEVKLRSAR